MSSADKPLEAAIAGVVENHGTTNQQSRGGGRTFLEQLRELQDAKNQGLLSEEEHAAAKAKALAVHRNGSFRSGRAATRSHRVVDRFEARQQGPNHVTYYRSSGRVGSTDRVDSSRAKPMES